MLSPNTLLNKARYRVGELLRGTPTWAIYAGVDTQDSSPVLIVERPNDPPNGLDIAHDGLAVIQDTFLMNGRAYYVTEAVLPEADGGDIRGLIDRFSVILMALNSLSANNAGPCEIGPEVVIRAADGRQKLLALESSSIGLEIDAWFRPIESVWSELDQISQRAIFNAWGEESIAGLERPADVTTDIYSLAAIFYRALTKVTPPGGFERTVVELDGSDPLVAPVQLVSAIGQEMSDFLLRCLALRREDRFSSLEDAILSLPTVPPAVNEEEEEDDILALTAPPVEESPPGIIAKVDVTEKFHVEPVLERAPVPEWHPGSTQEREIPAALEARKAETPAHEPAIGEVAHAKRTVEDTPLFQPIVEDAVVVAEDELIFSAQAKPRRSFGITLALAAVALMAIGGGTWAYLQYGSASSAVVSAAPAPVASLSAPAPIQTAPAAVPSPEPVSASATTPTPETSAPTNEAPRPQTAQVKQPAKPAEKPADKPKEKKKLTVDDLINDN